MLNHPAGDEMPRCCRRVKFVLTFIYLNAAFAQYSDRDTWQQPEKIMDVVGVKAGMIIGEAGAGRGYFTFYLSERVGENGRVFANDISERALRTIEEKCEKDSIRNITTIVGEVADPLFPEKTLDMVVMMRAFHDFTKPVEWMRNVIPSMKAGSSLVIIDQDPDRAGEGWHHFMTKEEVLATMAKTDFELVRIETFLQKDNIYIYKLSDEK
jgi:ubiquinone/menaquinone biosynthesis C-methylase UbiE